MQGKSYWRTKMITRYLLLLLIIAAQLITAQNFERSFKAGKGGDLSIITHAGNIIISVWDKEEIIISADDELKISANGNSFTTRAAGYIDEIRVTMPSRFNLKIKSSAGNIKIRDDLSGSIEVVTSGGDINFKNINGDAKISTGGGNIKGNDIAGSFSLVSSGGNVELSLIQDKSFIKTSGGNIKIGSVKNDIDIFTAGGNITMASAAGTSQVKTSGGNITVNENTGRLSVSTLGGNIKIKGNGSIQAQTNAGNISIDITSQLLGKIDASTLTGDIRLHIPSNLKATITAENKMKSIAGSYDEKSIISSDFPMEDYKIEGKRSPFRTVTLNGGGEEIKLKVSMGTIYLKKKN
jgi:DUF4097 and DUF4098 domain-containing protein YvlB